jgi:hypothetical protein
VNTLTALSNSQENQLNIISRRKLMSLRNISIALVSVLALSAAPAFAQDSAIIQDSVQTNTITGNRNTTKNTSTQAAGTAQRGRTGDAGVSQTNDQLSDVLGNRNKTDNVNNQSAGTAQRGSRR